MKKTVLITGSSRGIGKECAKLFHENGYNIVINYLSSQKDALNLKDELGGGSIAVKADVSDISQVQSMVNTAMDKFGNIDVLINNAAISRQTLFNDISESEWNTVMNINMGGVFNTCKCVLPDMIKRHDGNIINISSIWGMTGASCEVHYSTSKAAVIGFTKALAKEVGPSNIRVNCVAPGVINTDMNSQLDDATLKDLIDEIPLSRLGTARNIAETVLFLASERSSFITGQVISPNGGMLI